MRLPVSVLAVALWSSAPLVYLGCLPVAGDDGTSSSSGGTSSTSGADAGDGGTTLAGKACNDEATAYATAAQRCGGDYAAERTAFIKNLANGDCDSVSIRNETELRSQCIPSFSTISCADLSNGRFSPGCAEQIIRDK